MERILTPNTMALADKAAQDKLHIHPLVLMERAALEAVRVLLDEKFDLSSTLVVCGRGNNGGDGLCVARLLMEKGHRVYVLLLGKEESETESCKTQRLALESIGASFVSEYISDAYTTIVDAIFGISLNRDVEGKYREVIEGINASEARVLSLDMPSGIHGGDGKVYGIAVEADVTVTFAYKKIGQLLYPGARYCGKLICVNIGITQRALEYDDACLAERFYSLSEEDAVLPQRSAYSNKGTYGKVLMIAGSSEIAGAAILASMAAMRSGCGMLRVVTAQENKDAFTAILPEAMVTSYAGELIPYGAIEEAIKWCDCIAIGPGLSKGEAARRLVELALSQDQVPVIADADALNIIAEDISMLSDHMQDIIITPHAGEMARLAGVSIADVTSQLIDIAKDMAESYRVVCVLKDTRTVIASPSGEVYINCFGNSGMATAGSGDVLTGIIAGIIAQGAKAAYGAALGCAIHSRAGDKGAMALSEHELLARDIINYM